MTTNGFSMVALARAVNKPAVTLTAVALALALGIMQAPYLQYLRPVGEFYTALLQMCVLPFLLTTVPLAVRAAMTSGAVGHVVRLLVIWALLAIVMVALTSVVVPMLFFDHFFKVDDAVLARIGEFVGGSADRIDIEFNLDPTRGGPVALSVQSGLLALVPTNIFASLAGNDSMRVLVFAAVFGIAMVSTEVPTEHSVFGALRHIQKVCILIFDWFSIMVPVGIVALIAPQVALMGSEIFAVLAMFAYALLAVAGIVLVSAIVLVSISLRRPPTAVFASMLKPMMLGAATNNSLVCIPMALETMKDELKVADEPCALFIPVGIATLRFGAILNFIVATLFMGTLLGRTFSGLDLVLVALLSTAASFATIGASGLAALAPLAAVLRTFGLSYEVAVPLMVILDPIASIMRTIVNVAVNCAIPALASGRDRTSAPKTLAVQAA